MCKAVTCCLKFLLVLVAIVMMIVGIVLTVGGAFILWGLKFLLQTAIPAMPQMENYLKQIGVTANMQSVIDFLANNSMVIGAVAFAIGLVLLIISILLMVAMCCCSNKALFIVIVVFLSLVAIGLAILLAIIASKPEVMVLVPIEKMLQEKIINKYQAIDATNMESILVNILHIRLQCCGLTGQKDFATATEFKKSGSFQGGKTYTDIKFPISCCNYNTDFKILPSDLDSCLTSGTSDRKEKGCWDLIKPQLKTYLNYIYIAIGVTIAVLVAVVLVLICFISCMDKFE